MDRYDKLRSTINSLVEDGKVAGITLSLIEDGENIYNYSRGIKGVDEIDSNKKVPMDSRSAFRIASISKFVTMIGFLRLCERYGIGLDENIEKYLGERFRNPSFEDIEITFKMVLSHTSSIRDGEYYSCPLPGTWRDFFYKEGLYYENGGHFTSNLNEKPGEYFAYSNLNFTLIGTIIERVSKMRFDKYMEEEVFKPLDIKGSYNVKSELLDIDDIGTLFRYKEGRWIAQVDDYKGEEPLHGHYTVAIGDNNLHTPEDICGIDGYEIGSNGSLFSPHGGVRVASMDLCNIVTMILNNGIFRGKRYLSDKSIGEIDSVNWTYNGRNGDSDNGYYLEFGLSNHILKDRNLPFEIERLSGHSGEAYGLLSAMYYCPVKKYGFIYYITGSNNVEKGRDSSKTIVEEEILREIHRLIMK